MEQKKSAAPPCCFWLLYLSKSSASAPACRAHPCRSSLGTRCLKSPMSSRSAACSLGACGGLATGGKKCKPSKEKNGRRNRDSNSTLAPPNFLAGCVFCCGGRWRIRYLCARNEGFGRSHQSV